ncbi:hypothetical protein PVAP13_2NG413506 [Panicum virgatum]|uniref:Pentatricopeptide repeat-containing protein n=1 Tax=Panicum virgatum TaxID=38727 RepID=A0A8T0VMA5_PANVG|nr:hypothetical protein PVAP13_2NG413506 [Panicum virgatum]
MKSGRLAEALDLFDRMPRRNVVAWASVISGCTRNGRPEAAASMFAAMLGSGVAPNAYACNAALAACAPADALGLREQVHSLAVRAGLAWVGICLVELYSRCVSLRAAGEVLRRTSWGYTSLVSVLCRGGEFARAVEVLCQMMSQGLQTSTTRRAFWRRARESSELNSRNVVSWCSMMQLCIRDGRLGDALRVFSKMISESGGVLVGFNHAGLVEEGKVFFRVQTNG